MARTRKIEIFSAECPYCESAVQLVDALKCDSCEVQVLDVRDESVAKRARALGVTSIPAVVVDSVLADCCRSGGVTTAGLRAAGVGVSLA